MNPSICVRINGGVLLHCRSPGQVFVRSQGTNATSKNIDSLDSIQADIHHDTHSNRGPQG